MQKIHTTILILVALFINSILYSQCKEIYVSTTGTGVGSKASPSSLTNAISIATSKDVIKLATGTYAIDNAITLKDSITIEGGFIIASGWQKTSLAGATTINRTTLNPEGLANAQRLVALYGNNHSGFRLQDITITTAAANVAGMSTYGVHLTSCSNYFISRCRILPGNAANGAGDNNTAVYSSIWDGANGVNGANGITGTGANCSFGNDPGGNGGNGGGGAVGGVNATIIGGSAGNGTAGGRGGNGRDDSSNSPGDVGSAGVSGCGGTGGVGGIKDGNNADTPYGGTGGNGTVGVNGTNGITNPSSFVSGFFIPGQGTNGTAGTGGCGGGGGGGAGRDDGSVDASGGGGSGGGGGGGGGGAGRGAAGGGSSFAVYLYNNGANGTVVDCNGTGGIAGTAGLGGLGGNGGNGGTSALGNGCSNGDSDGNRGGRGGNGGAGGRGGNGGNGTAGISSNLYQDGGIAPIIASMSFTLSAQPVINYDNQICAFAQSTFTAPVAATWNFGATSSPSTATSAIASTSFQTIGIKDIIYNGNTYTGFVNISPFSVSQASVGATQTVCVNSGTLSGNIPTYGTGIWSTTGTAAIMSTTTNNTMVNNLNLGDNFFYWQVGNGGCCASNTATLNLIYTICSTLPIELLYFTASPQNNNQVNLNWSTASELNNAYFTVYKSSDALEWQVLGQLTGAGTSTQNNKYELIDENPYHHISYYKLKQTDFSGKTTNSKIVEVSFDLSSNLQNLSFIIYPNPTDGILNIEFLNFNNDAYVVELINAFGQVVLTENATTQNLTLNTNNLTNGVYVVKVTLTDLQISKRLIISK